jgi:hypothetical protein
VAFAVAVVGLVVVLTDGPEPPSQPAAADEWTAFAVSRFGVSGSLPAGWQLAGESQTPHLTDPREIVTVATFAPPAARDGRCNHLPGDAITAMGPRDALVSVQERGRGASAAGYPPRPARFAPGASDLSEVVRGCVDTPTVARVLWQPFSDSGRSFYALVALGAQAPAEQAYAILDRLRFDPGFEPDWPSAG